jgi:hypothetical protein
MPVCFNATFHRQWSMGAEAKYRKPLFPGGLTEGFYRIFAITKRGMGM